jgi:hypothetical protein
MIGSSLILPLVEQQRANHAHCDDGGKNENKKLSIIEMVTP